MNKQNLENILNEVYSNIKDIFGHKLQQAILYGSYARGDFDSESDIDIALIIDDDRMSIKKYDEKLVEQMSFFMLERDVLISFSEIPANEFEKYKNVLPYYMNIQKEGVVLGD